MQYVIFFCLASFTWHDVVNVHSDHSMDHITFFLLLNNIHRMDVLHTALFVNSSTDEYLGCFQIGAVTNNGALATPIDMFLGGCVF